MPFTCSICEEESTRICVACTKDSCDNHLCEKCRRCSDCCGCEVALNSARGTETFVPPEALAEPAGIPPDEVSGDRQFNARAELAD